MEFVTIPLPQVALIVMVFSSMLGAACARCMWLDRRVEELLKEKRPGQR